MISAPAKQLFIFEKSGHRPLTEETAHIAQVMREVVLADNEP